MHISKYIGFIVFILFLYTLAYFSGANQGTSQAIKVFNEDTIQIRQDYENKIDELNLKIQGLLMENSELIAAYSSMDNRCYEIEGQYERKIYFVNIPNFTQMNEEELIEYITNLSLTLTLLDKVEIYGDFYTDIQNVLNNANETLLILQAKSVPVNE